MDIDRKQRTDIDTVTNDRLTLAIDEGNIIESPYVQETIESFVGNNWIITDNVYVKYNLVEDDTIIFNYEAITELAQKDITKVTVSFDYLVENIINVLPVLANVSLNHSMITYKTVDLSLSDEGHVDIDCSLFDIDNEVLNTIISSQGFGIGLSFNGKLSNVTLKLSNVKVKFKFDDKLLPESNSVVNRLEPYIDFYRDGDNLILQVGGDASGKGMDRGGSNTYTKEEIDNKLAAKVNTQVGKMLSSNDYTNDEKTKLSGIEANANYYIHPFTHDSSIIVNSDALTNLDTSANASQSAINAAIDGAIGDKQDKLTSGENIKTINNESVLGSGNITIQGGSNVDIVTQWESTPSDSKVASEKLTKDSLDGKANSNHIHGVISNDGAISNSAVTIASDDKIVITDTSNSHKIRRVDTILASHLEDSNAHSNIGSSANDTQASINTNIDTALSNKVSKSSTSGLLKNDGTVDTTSYSTFSGSYNDLSNKPSIPSKISDLTNDSNFIETSSTSGLVKNDGTIDTTTYSTFSGSYADLSNKPSIPSSSSDLSDGSSLVKTSSTSGLIKNDGSVDTNTYLSSSALTDYVQKNIKVNNGENLNDITTTGFYYCPYNVVGTTISNTPNNVQSAFYLLVEDMGTNISNSKKQTFTTTSDGNTWIRTKKSGSWQSWKQLSTFSGSYDDLSNKPTIPSSSSDLSDGSSLVKTSSTNGLIKNDGSIDTNTYIASSSLPTKTSDLTNDGSSSSDSLVYVETSATSGLIKNDGTVDTTSYLSSLPSHNHDDRYYTESEMDTALSNKISKSGASGLVRNDGTIDASNYITSSALNGYQTTSNLVTSFSGTTSDSKYPSQKLVKDSLDDKINKSSTNGLIKNDGSIDTNTYLTQHQSLTDYVQKNNGANTMTDSSAYSTIGTSANATQKTINAAIDSKLDDIYDTFLCENLLFDESDLLGGS